MNDKTDLISIICTKLLSSDVVTAKEQLISEWEFKPLSDEPSRDTIPESRQIQVFFRDKFTCQYCGKRTVFIGTLRVISILSPKEFPYHPHWKWNETHPAFWELTSSCDHLVPVARGGKSNIDNLVTACYMCNSIKANWTLDELRWKKHEPADVEWDGLVGLFLQIMDHDNIQDKSLKNWYKLLKKEKISNPKFPG
ncbi:MAG: HNH endonuclease [Euryarchaeota archaeon]|nr:HNH endonuclease [Euryarchaeota archaeon]MCG2735368.1 HNH endonuclease [Candidatus Methanoperedenaceae archaeon]